MGLLSKKIRREELNPGDHIYTWRLGYSYSHHGIYVGDGKVVHLTRAPGLIIFSSSNESSPSHHSGEDRVVCCSIEDFLCGRDLYLYEYGVMKPLFIIKRGGTCTPFISDPPKDALHRASILQEKGFGDYNLFENNCEDFAIYCKTSLLRVDGPNRGTSGQIRFLFSIISVAILSPLGSLPPALALVIHAVQYCSLRLMLKEDDAIKVEVDDLSNRRTLRMENRRTSRSSLPAGYYIAYAIHTFNVWSWTPTSRILLWIRFAALLSSFETVVSDHLRTHRINLKVGEHVAWIILVLGYWYWSSDSRLYFWTKLFYLYRALLLFVSDQPSRWERSVTATSSVLVYWYWTPESTILLWIRFVLLFSSLKIVVCDHLRIDRFNLKVGEQVAWIIWLLGCWYWRSESSIYFWTKLFYLRDVLLLFVSDQPKLDHDIYGTAFVLAFWYWTPESTILQWIRLVFLHMILSSLVSDQFNNRFKFGRFFFACFVIQSAVLFMGLDYKDYFFRITKSIFL